MDRRTVLTSAGLAAVGLTAGPAFAAAEPQVPVARHAQYPGVEGKSLVNKPRAYRVMEEHGIDGLIALNPINVYYLANTWVLGYGFRHDYPAFATFPRDPQQPSFLIAGASQADEIAGSGREVPELIVMAGAANWQDYVNASPAQMKLEPKTAPPGFHGSGGFPVKKDGPFTPIEQKWIAAQKHSLTAAAPGPAWAIVKALKQSGLTKGTIAVDDMRIAYLLDQIGFTGVKIVPGEKIFQLIRMIKSEPELALQRIGGRNNAVAAMNTIKAIEKGMTFQDINRRFRTECAALGSESSNFIAGVSLALLPDGVVTPGKPFLIDAVSHFNQYHGDFGRSVVVGEPSKEILAREKAHKIGRDAVFEIVKPGVKFSELRRVAYEAQVKAGLPEDVVIVAVHSVGLQHDDNPTRLDVPYEVPFDYALEENMVVTIDLANVQIGWGAGHHEDMFRVTKTGFEFMAPPGDPLVVV